MNAPLDIVCVSDDDKATKIIQDIVVIKDDPPLMCKVPVSKNGTVRCTFIRVKCAKTGGNYGKVRCKTACLCGT